MRALLLGAVLVCSEVAAQGRILVAPLQEGLDSDRILQRTRDSLTARGWAVDAGDATSVAARNGSVRIRVFQVPGTLRYEALRGSISEEAIGELREELKVALGPVAAAAPTGKALMGYIPPGTTPAQVIQAARVALVGRRWVVLAGPEDVITAQLKSQRADATLIVFMTRAGLQYADEGEIPENWIANLRADIPRFVHRDTRSSQAQQIRAREAAPSPPPRPQGSADERLRALKQLFDSGMITRQEYDQKRAEILKDL
jgi:hypothetical protein